MTDSPNNGKKGSKGDPRQEDSPTKDSNSAENPIPHESGRITPEEAAEVIAGITGQTQPTTNSETHDDNTYEAPKRFWQHNQTRLGFYQAATITTLSPTAAYIAALARIASLTPPEVKTPLIRAAPELGLKGAPATSLNLMVAIVGPSGAGKSGIINAAKRALNVKDVDLPPNYTIEGNPASGEGVASLYSPRILPGDQETELTLTRRNALIANPEGSELFAKMSNKGSTLLPVTLKAVFGESLSSQKADTTQNRHVPEGSYSLAILFGIQPALAAQLIQDTSSGFAQRVLCVPISDSRVEEITDQMWKERKTTHTNSRHSNHEPNWKPPTPNTHFELDDHVERRLVEMLSTKEHQRGEIDKHRPAMLNKLMCLITLFDNPGATGRIIITEQCMREAELLLGICDMGRTMITNALKEEQKKQAQKQARAETELEKAKADIYADDLQADIKRILYKLTNLDKGQGISRAKLRSATLPRTHDRFDKAIQRAIEESHLHEKPSPNGRGKRVHLGPPEE